MSPQGTTDEAFQAYEPMEKSTNETFFFFAHLFPSGTRAPVSLKLRKKHFSSYVKKRRCSVHIDIPSLGFVHIPG